MAWDKTGKIHDTGLIERPDQFARLAGPQGNHVGLRMLHSRHLPHLGRMCLQLFHGAYDHLMRELSVVRDLEAHGFAGMDLDVTGCETHGVVHDDGNVAGDRGWNAGPAVGW